MSCEDLSPIGEKLAVKEELGALIAGFLFGDLEGIRKLLGTSTQQYSGWDLETAGSALPFPMVFCAWHFRVMWLTQCQNESLLPLLCKVMYPLLKQLIGCIYKDANIYRTYRRLVVTQILSAIYQDNIKKNIVNNLKLPLDALNYAVLINREYCKRNYLV